MFNKIAPGLSAVAAVAVVTMMLVSLADIAVRNALGVPIRGAFDLVELSLVICIFFGLPEVFATNRNIVVDVVDHFAGTVVTRKLHLFSTIVVGLFLLLLLYAMIEPGLDTIRYPEHKQETGLPTWLYWLPIFAGTVLSLAESIRAVLPKPQAE